MFPQLLRRHRTTRGLSQERLAREAEISTRHLSCLETGRAQPSKTMVLVLGSALDLPLRDRNAMLEAAGFVAAYRDVPLDAPDAAALRRAIGLILDGLEPNGAVAVDRTWNLLQMNQGAGRLLTTFLDPNDVPPEAMSNLVLGILHPKGLRNVIVNWEEVAIYTLDRFRREAARFPEASDYAKLRDAIAKMPDVPEARSLPTAKLEAPFLPVHLRRGDKEVRLFTLISTIGTPIDATAEDIRIETYFPADEASARFLNGLIS